MDAPLPPCGIPRRAVRASSRRNRRCRPRDDTFCFVRSSDQAHPVAERRAEKQNQAGAFLRNHLRKAIRPPIPMANIERVAGSETARLETSKDWLDEKLGGVPENPNTSVAPIGPGPGAMNVHSNEAGPAVGGFKLTVTVSAPGVPPCVSMVPAGPDTKVKSEILDAL